MDEGKNHLEDGSDAGKLGCKLPPYTREQEATLPQHQGYCDVA